MNIVMLNGSPRNSRSNSLKVTNAFLEGFCKSSDSVERVALYKNRIEPCRGCFSCWGQTPGKCVIKDDMSERLFDLYNAADVVVWSMPLYCFGMPSQVKAFCDRRLPACLPDMVEDSDGSVRHPPRVDLRHLRHFLISTCGFYSTKRNFEALLMHYEYMDTLLELSILCPQGEILGVDEAEPLWRPYLDLARQAGQESRDQGQVQPQTAAGLARPFMPPEAFLAAAAAHWRAVAASS